MLPAEPVPVLEFEVTAEDTARLLRLAAFTSRRQGRAKTQSVELVWHDTPAGDLAKQGLALAAQRGGWRLERLVPNGVADWLPATPAPVLAEAPTREALGRPVPQGLMPVAGFTGRQRQFPLADAHGTARLTLLEGALRGLTAERPACRLTLAGNPAAMVALADELAEDIFLGVPRAGLAADAASIAQGRAPSPRHLGGPAIPADVSVDAGLTLVIAHLADVILHWAPLTRPENGEEPVHQMRVAARRLRSALSVFGRVAMCQEWLALAGALKDLAARLGAARDWDVFLAGAAADVLAAFPAEPRVAALIAAAGRRRQAAYGALTTYFFGRDWQSLCLSLALLPTRRPWATHATPEQAALLAAPIEPYATVALDRRLKHVLAPGDDLSALAIDALHETRKQAKRLRYAAEFFAPLFPGKATRRFVGRLEDLQEALGAVNDRAVAAARMAELDGAGRERAYAVGVVQGYVAATGRRAPRDIGQAWKKLQQAAPFW